jgi:hypothetical protein
MAAQNIKKGLRAGKKKKTFLKNLKQKVNCTIFALPFETEKEIW